MKQLGLIGYPLTHSFSKKYFEEKFKRGAIADYSYQLFPIKTIEELPHLIESHPGLYGLNVTIPHKETVIPYLSEIEDSAREIGAVNCIKIANGILTGYNTDSYGFKVSLQKFLKHSPQQTFVLGTGGSAKAVHYVLDELKIPYVKVSRTPKPGHIIYTTIEKKLADSNLFINSTPLGMFPQINDCPDIPYHKLTATDYLFDLVYNPAETMFLQKGKQQGCHIKNGLEMLELQAEKSWEIWTA